MTSLLVILKNVIVIIVSKYWKRISKGLVYLFCILLILALSLFTYLDTTPIQKKIPYKIMMERLDSIRDSLHPFSYSSFQIGYAKKSITPATSVPLAGYGARNPKNYVSIQDSIFIRTLAIQNTTHKVAIISADLLIIHPSIIKALVKLLQNSNWKKEEIFFTTTHTHSSIGQWAPGIVGYFIAGKYSQKVVDDIAQKIMESIHQSAREMQNASFTHTRSSNLNLVYNRLVNKQGTVDPYLNNLHFKIPAGMVLFSEFSAHATCFSATSRKLSGDFPNIFHQTLATDSNYAFTLYAAGPVASMGYQAPTADELKKSHWVGTHLAYNVPKSDSFSDSIRIRSFSIPLALRKPQFKLTNRLIIRPYLFNFAFKSYPSQINVLQLNNTVVIGTPCDFSGELALSLYKYAENRGLNLIITSFNGGYIGYVTDDKWYHLDKFETKAMNWYGPDSGSYFTEIIKKTIEIIFQNN